MKLHENFFDPDIVLFDLSTFGRDFSANKTSLHFWAYVTNNLKSLKEKIPRAYKELTNKKVSVTDEWAVLRFRACETANYRLEGQLTVFIISSHPDAPYRPGDKLVLDGDKATILDAVYYKDHILVLNYKDRTEVKVNGEDLSLQ